MAELAETLKCARNRTGCRGLDRLRLRRMNRIHVQPLPIWPASNRSVQHLRVGVDAADHSEGFSIDLDQCPCFRRKFVTPGAEQSFGEFCFSLAVRKSATVSLLTTLVCEVTWVEPHRGLLVVVTKIPVLVERDTSVPHGHHRSDDPSFESSGCVHAVSVQLYQLRMRILEERIQVFRHAAILPLQFGLVLRIEETSRTPAWVGF